MDPNKTNNYQTRPKMKKISLRKYWSTWLSYYRVILKFILKYYMIVQRIKCANKKVNKINDKKTSNQLNT